MISSIAVLLDSPLSSTSCSTDQIAHLCPHAKRKAEFDGKLPKSHGIQVGGMVLLYDNRHKDFPGKLHTRWMGPYKVNYIFPNGSLQLEDLQGVWLDTRVNGSRVKKYVPENITSDGSSEDTTVRRDSHI